jgi:ribosomal protein L11 methyltransferase
MDSGIPYERLFIYHFDQPLIPNPWEGDKACLGCWVEAGYAFVFFSEPSLEKVRKELPSLNNPALLGEYEMSYEEWQGGSEINTVKVGRLIIYPYWRPRPVDAHCVCLAIDPGLVFGTGAHPTTLDSLYALHQVFSQDPPKTVVDLGTGTGILALAAAGLGAEKVIAVDLNPLCVRTARANVERNGLLDHVHVAEEDALQAVEYCADLVMANIHMAVMEQLIASPHFYKKKWAILSGLMRSQAKIIEYRLQTGPARIIARWESQGTWTTYLIHNSLNSLCIHPLY